ncbi:DUF3616 domain-containing protein [Pleurocapsales cyanobacterium LEGE 10410]|nr:DUF3616 domain-containing protein [Pleurocapsales cyanobacterium LEGE 10410]
MTSPYFLLTRVLLDFEAEREEIISDISAAAFSDDGSLWVGSDEMIGVERLSPVGCHSYGEHQRFLLQDYINLFNTDDEMDIEGMDFRDGYLWLTGSHSTKRKKPKKDDLEENLARLATITTDLNRFILARIPIVDGKLIKSYSPQEDKTLTAACLQTTEERNILFEALKEDRHLKPFMKMGIPSKDNGLDIEGLAIKSDRLFLGLRGPVLRGWAIILELELTETEPGILSLKEITDDGAKYKKYFLDLNGLGVRELCWQGDDLLILAGPTMAIEGEMQIFRWRDAGQGEGDTIQKQDEEQLFPLFDLPLTIGSDNAEGLALYSCWSTEDGLMVFYDSPNENRIRGDRQIFADVFRI